MNDRKTGSVARGLRATVLGAGLALAVPLVSAQQQVGENPSAGAMVGDLLVARPVGAVMTVGGAAAFIISLPFTAFSGHVAEAANTLVLGPGEATFMRCLGCVGTGNVGRDAELRRARGGREPDEAAPASP